MKLAPLKALGFCDTKGFRVRQCLVSEWHQLKRRRTSLFKLTEIKLCTKSTLEYTMVILKGMVNEDVFKIFKIIQ